MSMNKKNIAVTVTTLILFFVAAEFLLKKTRPGDLKTPNELRQVSLEYEPAVFSRQRILRESRDIIKSAETRFHINGYGYRGPEIDMPKKRTRIIIYGGSAVFDPLVSVSWPEKVQEHLNKLSYDVEVINAGIPGASSAEIAARFFSEVLYLRPDFVLMYEGWNDVRFFNPQSLRLDQLTVLDKKKNFFLYPSGRVDSLLSENSYLYLMARNWYLQSIAFREQKNIPYVSRKDRYGNEKNFFGEIYNFGSQVNINTKIFIEAAFGAGVRPIIVTQAVLPVYGINEESRKKIDFSYVELNLQGILQALKQINEQQIKAAKDKKADLIDANSKMSGRQDLFFDHVHFSKAGSDMFAHYMAESLAPYLQRVGATKR